MIYLRLFINADLLREYYLIFDIHIRYTAQLDSNIQKGMSIKFYSIMNYDRSNINY